MVSAAIFTQGEVYWADLGDPVGSSAGYRRPVVIVQGNPFNRSKIATVLCVPLTSNLKWAAAPGNVLLTSKATGLDRDSVANVSLLVAIDACCCTERTGKLTSRQLEQLFAGIDIVLDR